MHGTTHEHEQLYLNMHTTQAMQSLTPQPKQPLTPQPMQSLTSQPMQSLTPQPMQSTDISKITVEALTPLITRSRRSH